jgi:hypothetical protein
VPPARVRLTAAKSSLGRHRKLHLARPRARTQPRLRKTVSASPDPRARTPPRPRKTVSASPDPGLGLNLDSRRRSPPRSTLGLGLHLNLGRRSPPRPTQGSDSTSTPEDGLCLARPQGSDSTSTSNDGLRLARPQGSGSTSTSEESPPRPTSGSDRPRHRGPIITLPLASSGYGEQDRRPIWLAPVKQVMMAPRVLHDDVGSQPLMEARRRQQGLNSSDNCAPTGLRRSSDGHDIT